MTVSKYIEDLDILVALSLTFLKLLYTIRILIAYARKLLKPFKPNPVRHKTDGLAKQFIVELTVNMYKILI